tara:strand:+ start:176 stop:505 length:330 start_codon:yes stop_codon:yes gene_type:complete
MNIRELKVKMKDDAKPVESERYKWDEIKDDISDKNSLCCNVGIIILGGRNQDIGICSKCKKFSMDRKKKDRLSSNRNQSFKRIADDALYNFDGKTLDYKIGGKNARNEK